MFDNFSKIRFLTIVNMLVDRLSWNPRLHSDKTVLTVMRGTLADESV
jgi:hypothetical protein